jgi:peptidoglycan/LPS O-acetylase OafA/YrhL
VDNHTNQKFYGLDHLRALAIILVFLFHYYILTHGEPSWLPDLASFGWTGVDLFFVLSGFLISLQLFTQVKAGQKISFKVFFLKRAFRIIPAFLVTIALYFCIPFFREKESLPPLWKFLTFTQNLGLDLRTNGTFSHAWSLCVEEHFYLFLPLILILLQSTRFFAKAYWLLITLFVLGFLTRTYSYNALYLPQSEQAYSWAQWYKYIYYPTYNRLDGLLVGVGIAAIYRFLPGCWNRLSRYGNLFLVTGLLILTGAYFLCEQQQTFYASVWGFPLIALGYGCLLTGAVSPGSILYKWNSKATTFMATLSYAIYLTHKGVISMTNRLLDDFELDANLVFFISIITCVLFAYLLHRLVEKPFMRLRNKLVKPG